MSNQGTLPSKSFKFSTLRRHPVASAIIAILVFVLWTLPLSISQAWPAFVRDKTIPEWLAERRWPGMTAQVYGWMTILFFFVLAILLVAIIIITRRKESQSTSSTGEASTDKTALQAAESIKKLECAYQFTHNIAENEELDLHKAVLVKEINISYELEDQLPYIDFKFTIFNGSVYTISTLNEIEGYVSFRKKRLMGNIQMERGLNNLSHTSEGTIIIRLQLSKEEAEVISRADDRNIDYFYFNQLGIKVNGGRFYPNVQPAPLKLPDLIPKGNDEEIIDKLTKQIEGAHLELARLREENETQEVRIKMRDDEFNKYITIHERADNQRQEINEYVILEGVYFCYQHLAAPERLRSIFALDIRNKSVFDITVEGIVEGYIRFEGTPLTEKPRIVNPPVTATAGGEASITIEQPLTRGEAEFIESQNPQFAEFDLENLVIIIKGREPSEGVQPKSLKIARQHSIARINQTRKDIKELSARIKELEEEQAARIRPDITGKIKGVYFEWWANGELSNSKQMYFDYHFVVNIYLANRGTLTTIEQFKFALKVGDRSYDGERERDVYEVKEGEMNWREWGAAELDDLEKSNDVPFEQTRNGWLWFVVRGVPNTKDESEMELELSVIDKDGASYKLGTFPRSKWENNPFLHEARVKEARDKMRQMF